MHPDIEGEHHMLTIIRILLGAGLSAAGIVGALYLLITSGAGIAFVCFVCCQLLCALILPDDPGEPLR